MGTRSMIDQGFEGKGAQRERARIRRHLQGAEQLARARRPRLSWVRALNRALLLDELARYRERGRFPRNLHVLAPTPVFVDELGTHCAVGHLMAISGLIGLVEHVRVTENRARVAELARQPAFLEWLAAAGLTVGEAARIQPSYCYESEAEACFCSHSAGSESLVLGTITSLDGESMFVRVERIEGAAAGVAVGDELEVYYSVGDARIGERALLSRTAESDGSFFLFRSASLWDSRLHAIDDDQITCPISEGSRDRSEDLDLVMNAVLLDSTACVEALIAKDDAWGEAWCDRSSTSSDRGGGCAVAAPVAATDRNDVLALAILIALLARRRRWTGA